VPPEPGEDTLSDGPAAAPSTPSIQSASGVPFPHITNPWRGLFTLSLGLTLCALAVAEATGEASAPAWFLGFAIPVLTEWVGEWVVWGRKRAVHE
jgi:hypothetical protein